MGQKQGEGSPDDDDEVDRITLFPQGPDLSPHAPGSAGQTGTHRTWQVNRANQGNPRTLVPMAFTDQWKGLETVPPPGP